MGNTHECRIQIGLWVVGLLEGLWILTLPPFGLELMTPVIQYNNEGSENSQELHVRHFLFVFTLSKPVEGFWVTGSCAITLASPEFSCCNARFPPFFLDKLQRQWDLDGDSAVCVCADPLCHPFGLE